MKEVPQTDAADALAVALCHSHERNTQTLYREVTA